MVLSEEKEKHFGALTCDSESFIFSALLAFLHSTLCDPYRLINSIESNPLPSDETKMAELIRARLQRVSIACTVSSGHG